MKYASFLLLAGISGLAATAQADIFHLKNGGRLEGQWLNAEQKPVEQYVIQTSCGAQIILAEGRVKRVETPSVDLKWYQERLPKTLPTVEGHWEIAKECQKRRLEKQRRFHLQKILELEPQHEQARYGLGYSRVEGKWVLTDQWMQKRGYIRYGGSWRIAQDVKLEIRRKEQEKLARETHRQIRTWRTQILKNRGQNAIAEIRALKDPLAAAGLADLLNNKDKKTPPTLRRLCATKLGELKTTTSIHALVKAALIDPDVAVRETAQEELGRMGGGLAARLLEKELKHNNNLVVNRAAVALGFIKDPNSALPLIDALVTEHKAVVSTGNPGQMSAGFGGPDGGLGNLSAGGGGPKLLKGQIYNRSVHAALVALFPGVNNGPSQKAWKDWYADQQAGPAFNLRRSE